MGRLDGRKLILYINDIPVGYCDDDPFEFIDYSIDHLKNMLNDSVEREDYETAAKIRDYIKKHESK